MTRICTLVLLLALVPLVCFAKGGIQFTELMSGYFAPGNMSYQDAYNQGKLHNQTMYFTLTAIVPDLKSFLDDPNHTCHIQNGTLHVNQEAFRIEDWTSTLELFDHGAHPPFYILNLKYTLFFRDSSGEAYHLEGIKNIYGNSCIHMMEMFTTLFVHIRKGWQRGTGDIKYTAILTIDPAHVATWLMSFRAYKCGILDFVINLEKFTAFLLKNIKDDCSNVTALYSNKFWYIWGATNKQGFLLDLIRRPTEAELRLDIYQLGEKPQVLKEYFPLEKFHADNNSVTIGPLALTLSDCKGTVDLTPIQVQFSLSGNKQMHFLPSWLNILGKVMPDVYSFYGELSQAKVGQLPVMEFVPMVFTRYVVPIGMGVWQWSMISAHRFTEKYQLSESDLRVETMFLNVEGFWIGGAYVFFKGKQYQFNNPLLQQSKLLSSGSTVDPQEKRTFSVEINAMLKVHLKITCEAPETQFALLEREGNTKIHTTVLGSCVVVDYRDGRNYTTRGGALLEVKY